MKRIRLTTLFAAALMLAACTADRLETGKINEEDSPKASVEGAVEGRIIVKLSSVPQSEQGLYEIFKDLNPHSITRTFPEAGKFEERHRKYGLDRWYTVDFDTEIPLTKASDDAMEIAGVEYLDFDYRVVPNSLPFNDPGLSYQWHYYNTGEGSGVAGSDMNVFAAWEITTGTPDVIVAVSDGGVDYAHEDLAANMWVNEAELYGTEGKDDDGNGYVDDIYGFNFVADDSPDGMVGTIEYDDHGTHVAGTIAAVNNNGKGVSGVAGGNGQPDSGARIMSVQTIGKVGSYLARSVIYAADNGAVLMNCSWSLPDVTSTPQNFKEAIQYFNETAGMDTDGNQVGPMAGGVIFFSAGNDSKSAPDYPASEENVIAIAAIGDDYTKAYYSNYGDWVDLTAPGGDYYNRQVYSTLPNNSYGYMQGTSMACPHAVGAAALVVSRFKGEGFTRDHLIHILKSTASKKIYDYNPGYEGMLGVGLIDTYAAVTWTEGAPKDIDGLDGEVYSNNITLKWTVPGEAGESGPNRFIIYSSTSSLAQLNPQAPGSEVTVSYLEASGMRASEQASFEFTGLEFTTEYHFRVQGENINGERSALSEEFVASTPANRRPDIEALDPTDITLKAYEQAIMRFRISDYDGHQLTWSVNPVPEGAVCTESGDLVTISIDARKATGGQTYSGTLVVSDPYDESSVDFSYTVLPNNAPEAIGAISSIVFNSTSDKIDLNLSSYFKDEDGEQLKYSYTLSPSTVIVKGKTSVNTMTVSAFAYGSCTMTITAEDACGESASISFPVLVRDGSVPVDLYPNPVDKELNIRLPEDSEVSIRVSNKAGAVLFSEDDLQSGPFAPYTLDMSGYAGGVYYVHISGDGIDETMSVIKK